jgi:hypothetical protein
LLGRKLRIPSLGHCSAKHVQTANILVLRRNAAEGFVEALRVSAAKLLEGAHAENFKVAKHGRTDGDQIRELARIGGHKNLLDSRESRI